MVSGRTIGSARQNGGPYVLDYGTNSRKQVHNVLAS